MTREQWADRLYAKTRLNLETGCWEWSAGKTPANGYPIWQGPADMAPEGKSRFAGAHRWSYILTHGAIPEGLVIDHLCRNRACINPSHLEAVTQRTNINRALPYRQPRPRVHFDDPFAWVPVQVRAELAARRIFHRELAAVVGWDTNTTHSRMAGKSAWLEAEVQAAASFLGRDVESLTREWVGASVEQVSA